MQENAKKCKKCKNCKKTKKFKKAKNASNPKNAKRMQKIQKQQENADNQIITSKAEVLNTLPRDIIAYFLSCERTLSDKLLRVYLNELLHLVRKRKPLTKIE